MIFGVVSWYRWHLWLRWHRQRCEAWVSLWCYVHYMLYAMYCNLANMFFELYGQLFSFHLSVEMKPNFSIIIYNDLFDGI